MIQPVVAAALVAVVGGMVAIAARDDRVVALGLLVAMVAAPFASSPQPTVMTVAFRILGSLLAAYLVLAAARSQSILSEGSGIGVLAEMAIAAAAFSIGWFILPVNPLAGPLAAQAAGVALVALAIVPLTGRDVFRAGIGAAVLVIGGSLLLQAWAGPSSSVGQIVLTALLVAVAGATSLLISPFDAPAATRKVMAESTAAVPLPAGQSPAAAGADVPPDGAADAASAAAAPGIAASASFGTAGLAGDGRTGDGRAGPVSASRKATRVTAKASASPPSPDAPATRARPSTIRISPYRPLRTEGWDDPSRLPGGATPAEEAASQTPEPAPEPAPEEFPPAGRVKRLRPREPRR